MRIPALLLNALHNKHDTIYLLTVQWKFRGHPENSTLSRTGTLLTATLLFLFHLTTTAQYDIEGQIQLITYYQVHNKWGGNNQGVGNGSM